MLPWLTSLAVVDVSEQGGAAIVKMPVCNRSMNVLLLEPEYESQMALEKVCRLAAVARADSTCNLRARVCCCVQMLRTQNVKWDLAAGSFDPTSDRNEGIVADAISRLNRLLVRGGVVRVAQHRSVGCQRVVCVVTLWRVQEVARRRPVRDPSMRGRDTTAEVETTYSCVLVNASASLTSLPEVRPRAL